jgi:signal transduction histidine kinase/ActR/RegA family two-component response regulator
VSQAWMAPALSSERDSVLREVEQLLALARTVRLGPEFDEIIRRAVEGATDRLVAATRRRTARLAALAAVQQTVAAGFDLPAIMAGVYQHLREILDAPCFLVASYDAGSRTLHQAFAVVDGRVLAEAAMATPLSGAVQQVIATRQARIVNDVAEPGPGTRRPSSGDAPQPVRSTLYVPMTRGDEVIGLIQAQSYRPDAYGEEDVEFLTTIANQTAMALENARLYTEALRRNQEVEALLTAAQHIGAELAPERVLHRVVEAAASLIDAEIVTGATVSGSDLRFERLRLPQGWRDLNLRVPVDTALPDLCAGQPLLDNAPDALAAGPLAPVLPPLRNRLQVPIVGSEQRVLGVILLFNKRGPGGFNGRDLELTAALASHAATALERANAYRAMEQSRNYLQTLMDRTYAAVFVFEPHQGQLRDINIAGARLLGRPREEALALTVDAMVPEAERTAWWELVHSAPTGGAVERELQIVAADGITIPLDVTATRVDVNDEPAVVCLCLDRRPRLRQEEAERLRALGEMASGVAHDFNNMLGVILGRTELLISRLSPDERAARADLQVIRQAALDGAETVKRLQVFSGVARSPQQGVADVARVLRDAVELTRARWKDAARRRGVAIDVLVEAGDCPPVAASPPELREVLVNMIFNAVDAMPHGGRITLRSWARGDRVFISVSDTGVGMTEAVRSKIFEPFFTTKGSRGSGLGLSASYGIISRLGGTISVESAPYQGTTFTVELPAGEPQPSVVEPPRERAAPLNLLLVDDEPQMLRTTKMMLELEGHRVTPASGGAAALELLATRRFDAVLTDLGMPEMNGLQLAEHIRARGLTLPILLITGWGLELEAERVQEAGITDVLPKPFDGDQLRTTLARLASSSPITAHPVPAAL